MLTTEQLQSRAQKARDTMLHRYGKDYYRGIGREGGKRAPSSTHNFIDPIKASKAANIRWARYYAKKTAEAEAELKALV